MNRTLFFQMSFFNFCIMEKARQGAAAAVVVDKEGKESREIVGR